MKPELKNFQKSISTSRKRTENELFALQTIETLIKDSAGKEWIEVSPGLKTGIFLARLKGEGIDDQDLFFAVQNSILNGLRECPTSPAEDSIFDFFSLDKLEVLV